MLDAGEDEDVEDASSGVVITAPFPAETGVADAGLKKM